MTIQEEISRRNSPEKAELCTKSSPTHLHGSHPWTLSPQKFPRSQGTPLGTHLSGEQAGLVGTGASCVERVWCVYLQQPWCHQHALAPPTRWKVNFLECVKREPLGVPGLAPAPQACSTSPRSRACCGGPGRPQVWRRCSARCFCSRCR